MTILQGESENQLVVQKSPVLCRREIIGDADKKLREGNVDRGSMGSWNMSAFGWKRAGVCLLK